MLIVENTRTGTGKHQKRKEHKAMKQTTLKQTGLKHTTLNQTALKQAALKQTTLRQATMKQTTLKPRKTPGTHQDKTRTKPGLGFEAWVLGLGFEACRLHLQVAGCRLHLHFQLQVAGYRLHLQVAGCRLQVVTVTNRASGISILQPLYRYMGRAGICVVYSVFCSVEV